MSSPQGDVNMSARSLLGIALLVLGLCALAYQGFSYTVAKRAVDLGPIKVTKEERHTIPLPPIVGALALVAGVAVLAIARRGGQ
jgi:uncharacterized membrane protein HdeD (DUF308 family)